MGKVSQKHGLTRDHTHSNGEKHIFDFSEIYRYRFVIENYIFTNLAQKYRHSLLGYAWSVVMPLLRYLVMGIVFYYVAKSRAENYFGYMFLGSVLFGFIQTALTTAGEAFIVNEQYIKKIYLPKMIFVINVITYELINFLLVLSAVLILLTVFGQIVFSFYMLYSLLPIVLVVFFLTGVSMILAVVTVYFRDMRYILNVALQALFFLTPVMYPRQLLPRYLRIFNPFYYYVELFRQPILDRTLPNPAFLLVATTLAAVAFLAGLLVLRRFEHRIIFKL